MSNELAISGVTAILQFYLHGMYSKAVGFASPVTVSCRAPDQVKIAAAGSSDPENQVNLFMHQVTHNPAWRNADLPSMSMDGGKRLQNPPLALNLHYLLTAYGSNDWQAEALLGYALMMLHEAPVLTRQDVLSALQILTGPPGTFPGNPLTPHLAGSGLADQIEMIKITPETLGREEMAWLWTALKADYRPTFPFQVSVVLMQPSLPTTVPLPVLRRVLGPQPMKVAELLKVQYPQGQTASLPGDTVTVTGENLVGATQVLISNKRYGDLTPILIDAGKTLSGSTEFKLPLEGVEAYPAGVFELAVQFLDRTGSFVQQTTNPLAFAVAPALPTQTAATAVVAGSSLLAVTVSGLVPPVYEGQTVTLSLSFINLGDPNEPIVNRSAPAQPFTGKVSALTFQMEPGLPTGKQLLGQMLVDGVSSQVAVQWTPFPPVFNGPWVTLP